jgi:hypothetical protein
MTSTLHLEPFATEHLKADKPIPAPERHARTAREILEGKTALPEAPDVAALPELWNAAVLAIRGHEAAAAEIDQCDLELATAENALADATGSLHEGKTKSEAIAVIRDARDAADLANLSARRAKSVFSQVAGRRRNALLELATAVESAGKATATRAAVKVLEAIDASLDPVVGERLGNELTNAVNVIVGASGAVAAIGGRTALLHDRVRDIRTAANPTPDAVAYCMRSVRELIELMQPPAPAAELPVDPILRGIVDEATKPRRRRAA